MGRVNGSTQISFFVLLCFLFIFFKWAFTSGWCFQPIKEGQMFYVYTCAGLQMQMYCGIKLKLVFFFFFFSRIFLSISIKWDKNVFFNICAWIEVFKLSGNNLLKCVKNKQSPTNLLVCRCYRTILAVCWYISVRVYNFQ